MSLSTMERRSTPISTLSRAAFRSASVTVVRPARPASSAASLTRFARSAPEKPGVPRAMTRRSAAGIDAESCGCGRGGWPRGPSDRGCRPSPGDRTARAGGAPDRGCRDGWWRQSPRCRRCASKPSISTSSWLSVCSRSSWLSELPPRLRPTASSSSMKMMQDGWRRASRKSRRTRDAPTPAYISTKSDPLAKRNGTPASPAIDRASSVLPVPGGPTSRTPFGIRPPIAAKRPGSLQEIDDFLHLVLGLVHAGHVLERDHVLALLGDAGAARDGRDAPGRGPIDGEAEQREECRDGGRGAPTERARFGRGNHVDANVPAVEIVDE